MGTIFYNLTEKLICNCSADTIPFSERIRIVTAATIVASDLAGKQMFDERCILFALSIHVHLGMIDFLLPQLSLFFYALKLTIDPKHFQSPSPSLLLVVLALQSLDTIIFYGLCGLAN